jgi:hypothetical protein
MGIHTCLRYGGKEDVEDGHGGSPNAEAGEMYQHHAFALRYSTITAPAITPPSRIYCSGAGAGIQLCFSEVPYVPRYSTVRVALYCTVRFECVLGLEAGIR